MDSDPAAAVALEPRVRALEQTQEARATETRDAHRRIVQLLAQYGDYAVSYTHLTLPTICSV